MTLRKAQLKADFDALPVKEHWDAIAKHQAELLKIYTGFAEDCGWDLKDLKKEVILHAEDMAIGEGPEYKFDAENLKWYLDFQIDLADE
jgi:hypothetical protein